MATSNGIPFCFRVDHKDWKQGHILVLSQGELTLNWGAVSPAGRALTPKLFESLPVGSHIGFLESSSSPLVLKNSENVPGLKGIELLTVWPLNWITLHGVILGIMLIVAGIPIFGRPRQLHSESTQDFGQHVEALGNLLAKTDDRMFAIAVIRDYFLKVRRDPQSPWANTPITHAIQDPLRASLQPSVQAKELQAKELQAKELQAKEPTQLLQQQLNRLLSTLITSSHRNHLFLSRQAMIRK